MYIPSVYRSSALHAQRSGLSLSPTQPPPDGSPANDAVRRAWSAISGFLSSETPTHQRPKRDSSQATNVTIAVLVAVFVTLFFALLFWFLYRYGATVRLKASKKRHRHKHRHGHGRHRSGGSRSSKSMKSGGGDDSAPPSPDAGPSEPPPAE